MNVYKVWIQIKRIDENQNRGVCMSPPYEAGEFNTEAEAERFVKNELIVVKPVKLDLLKVCRAGFKFLDSLPVTQLTSQRQNREAFRKMPNNVLTRKAPLIDDRCPKCGGSLILINQAKQSATDHYPLKWGCVRWHEDKRTCSGYLRRVDGRIPFMELPICTRGTRMWVNYTKDGRPWDWRCGHKGYRPIRWISGDYLDRGPDSLYYLP